MVDMTTRTPLRELFDSVTSANGWSLRDVAQRIQDRKYELSRSRISQILNAAPLESITRDKIMALAVGLGIAPDRIAVAAFQSMGYRLGGDEITPAEAIQRDVNLSEDTRRALLSILRAAGDGRGSA